MHSGDGNAHRKFDSFTSRREMLILRFGSHEEDTMISMHLMVLVEHLHTLFTQENIVSYISKLFFNNNTSFRSIPFGIFFTTSNLQMTAFENFRSSIFLKVSDFNNNNYKNMKGVFVKLLIWFQLSIISV